MIKLHSCISLPPSLLRLVAQALDLDLDGARLGVARRLERVDCVLESEAVGDQVAQLDHAALD